jgi:hypothetical protein
MRLSFLLLVAFLLVLISSKPSHAAIAPEAMGQQQQRAKESLIITVLSVNTGSKQEGDFDVYDYVVTAKVIKVIKSTSDLRVGQSITINYRQSISIKPRPGAQPIPTLQPEKTYPSFLDFDSESGSYRPAAGFMSFTELR